MKSLYSLYILVISAFRHTVCANAPKTFVEIPEMYWAPGTKIEESENCHM